MATNPELWVANDYPHLRDGLSLAVLLDQQGAAIASAEVEADGRATFFIRGPVVTGAWVARTPEGGDVMHVPVTKLYAHDGTLTIDTTMEQS